jgi:uncharacterized membrane protein YphA (DoxX/SURF4 family)
MGHTMLATVDAHHVAGVRSNATPRAIRSAESRRPRAASVLLWGAQGLLALVFLAAGGMKLALPLEVLAAMFPLPGLFVRFIGTAELLGAIGLVLPGLLRIRPGLTPLAALGLVLIMTGATTITLATGGDATALVPFTVWILAALVAYGRWPAIRELV